MIIHCPHCTTDFFRVNLNRWKQARCPKCRGIVKLEIIKQPATAMRTTRVVGIVQNTRPICKNNANMLLYDI